MLKKITFPAAHISAAFPPILSIFDMHGYFQLVFQCWWKKINSEFCKFVTSHFSTLLRGILPIYSSALLRDCFPLQLSRFINIFHKMTLKSATNISVMKRWRHQYYVPVTSSVYKNVEIFTRVDLFGLKSVRVVKQLYDCWVMDYKVKHAFCIML